MELETAVEGAGQEMSPVSHLNAKQEKEEKAVVLVLGDSGENRGS